MGAIAEGFVAYAQRLLDQTDGSEGQVKKAFAVSQCCFNLALMPEGIREQTLGKMKQSLEMNDEIRRLSTFHRRSDDPAAREDVPADAQAGFEHLLTRRSFAEWPVAAGAAESGGVR